MFLFAYQYIIFFDFSYLSEMANQRLFQSNNYDKMANLYLSKIKYKNCENLLYKKHMKSFYIHRILAYFCQKFSKNT
ncbi:MAG: hypothetical protein DRH21_04215 [Deltaproteobacteria bacterium]|nr:MAG: hypothetical protein DRH21_04215 [Deltaproteobacteria bacterium]